MKIAVMQPYIYPYLGYFQLINAVDKFVFYDDVNYIKKGWINRNQILVNKSPFLFTIPLKEVSQNKLINEIDINIEEKWKRKFLLTIQQFIQKRTSFLMKFLQLITTTFNTNCRNIAELSIYSRVKTNIPSIEVECHFELSSEKYSNSKSFDKQND
jgi:hypothetical protein